MNVELAAPAVLTGSTSSYSPQFPVGSVPAALVGDHFHHVVGDSQTVNSLTTGNPLQDVL